MKTIETKLYSYSELNSEAQERVLKNHSESVYSDPNDFTLSECIDSLKAITDAIGTPLRAWQMGPFNHNNYAKVDALTYDYEEVDSGPKTVATFLRMLITYGYTRPKHFQDMEFPGICGFTGICFDDDLCEFLWKELLTGETWQQAIYNCADHIGSISEKDLEWRASKESFLDYNDGQEIYTRDGEIV